MKVRSLTRILLAKIIGLSLLLGSLFGAIQVILDFYDQYNIQRNAIDHMLSVTSGTAARLALELDNNGAQYLVNGLMETPHVVKVSLLNEFGEVLASREKKLETNPFTSRLTALLSKKKDEYSIELHYPKDPNIRIGQLNLSVSWDHAMQSFYRRAMVVFLTGIVRAMILAFLLYFVISIILTRPLLRVIHEVSSSQSPEGIGSFRIQVPDASKGKELNELAGSINNQLALISSYLRDIEEARKNLEKRVKERTRELNEARINAEAANHAKSVFLANMSHELRTPLNAILGYGQLLRQDPGLPEQYQKTIKIIRRSGTHLLRMIDEILEISKIESGHILPNKTAFNLPSLLDTIMAMVLVRAEKKGLELKLVKATNLPKVISADENKLHQILSNLLSNGIKYTDAGRVELRVDVNSTNCQLMIQVDDTGMGIDPKHIEHVFEPFYQNTDHTRSNDGAGLGLSLVKRYVEVMDGTISVESKPGEGTTFQIELPYEPAQEAEIEKREAERQVVGIAADQPRYKILVVEDNPDSRSLLEQMLEQVGFSTRTATNGQEAVDIHEAWDPDLIWMDIRMPVMDGLEATRSIREREASIERSAGNKSTIIIALTASVFDDAREEIMSSGFDDFIRKPFITAEIFECMARYLTIEYIYQVDQHDTADAELAERSLEVRPADLKGLSDEWLTMMRQAALKGRSQQVIKLVEEIRKTHPRLADLLTSLASDFQADKIPDLLDRN